MQRKGKGRGEPAKARVIELARENGSTGYYRPLADRLADFNEQFPVRAGEHRLVIEAHHPLDLFPGLARLYEVAISAGKKPVELGLPDMSALTIVFRSKLLDREGNIVATASALKPIDRYKDWESGESSAHQRLLARLGHGGDILDDDEIADMIDQGLQVKIIASERGAAGNKNGSGAAAAAPKTESGGNGAGASPAAASSAAGSVADQATEAGSAPEKPGGEETNGNAALAKLRQRLKDNGFADVSELGQEQAKAKPHRFKVEENGKGYRLMAKTSGRRAILQSLGFAENSKGLWNLSVETAA
jgi:hypothetical protein